MRITPSATRWCHLTWSTARHHKFFNIAALARFCERTLVEECGRLKWYAEVAVLPDRVHLLVRVPGTATRDDVIKRITAAAARVTRRSAELSRAGQVWEKSMWCAMLTSGSATEAVRRYIHGRTSVREGSVG